MDYDPALSKVTIKTYIDKSEIEKGEKLTEQQAKELKAYGVDVNKIHQGCEYIFNYLDENGFSLLEIKHLISSMGIIAENMTKLTHRGR